MSWFRYLLGQINDWHIMKLFFFKYATRKNTQNPMHRYSRMKFDCIFIGRQIENCAIKTGYIYCTVYSNSFMQKQTEKRNHQKLFQFFFLLWLDKITWHKRWKHMEQMNAFTLVQWDADRNRRRTKVKTERFYSSICRI